MKLIVPKVILLFSQNCLKLVSSTSFIFYFLPFIHSLTQQAKRNVLDACELANKMER